MPSQASTESRADTEHPSTENTRSTTRGSDDTAQSDGLVPIADLLERETTIPFAGLTPHDDHEYPDGVSPENRCFSSSPTSLKEAIKILPEASYGELWTTNKYVGTQGDIDIEAIRRVDGLDVDALESAFGRSLEDLAEDADSDPIIRVRDHKDIVDERRKALNALGYDVKFR